MEKLESWEWEWGGSGGHFEDFWVRKPFGVITIALRLTAEAHAKSLSGKNRVRRGNQGEIFQFWIMQLHCPGRRYSEGAERQGPSLHPHTQAHTNRGRWAPRSRLLHKSTYRQIAWRANWRLRADFDRSQIPITHYQLGVPQAIQDQKEPAAAPKIISLLPPEVSFALYGNLLLTSTNEQMPKWLPRLWHMQFVYKYLRGMAEINGLPLLVSGTLFSINIVLGSIFKHILLLNDAPTNGIQIRLFYNAR